MQLYLHKHKIGLDGSNKGTKYLGYSKKEETRCYLVEKNKTVWTKHLDKYGHDFSTEILYSGDDQELLESHAMAYSLVHKIWDNPLFANQMMEIGKPGGVKARWQSKKTLKKRSKSSTGFQKELQADPIKAKIKADKVSLAQKGVLRPERQGGAHPSARPFCAFGKEYGCLREAEIGSGLSVYKLRKRARDINITNVYYKGK